LSPWSPLVPYSKSKREKETKTGRNALSLVHNTIKRREHGPFPRLPQLLGSGKEKEKEPSVRLHSTKQKRINNNPKGKRGFSREEKIPLPTSPNIHTKTRNTPP